MPQKLSIIIPAYNEARTIHRILDRIEAVDLIGGLERELIIVNDYSTDDTKDAILKYQSAHPNLNIKYMFGKRSRYAQKYKQTQQPRITRNFPTKNTIPGPQCTNS